MNNKDFIANLASETGYTQSDTQKMMRAIIDEMGNRFEQGDMVQIPNLGTFEVKKRLERIIVNPSTQKRMLVPPKLVLQFKPITAIKDILKGKEAAS